LCHLQNSVNNNIVIHHLFAVIHVLSEGQTPNERNRLIGPSQGTRQMHRDPTTQDDPCYSMCTRLVSAKKFANVSVKHLINAFEM